MLVVEGEKCRDAAAALLDGAYAVVVWPGGCNAVSKVDWSPLANRRLVLWPDCDAQQNKERAALLPRAQQPGEMAMQAIAARLVALGCQVQVMNVGEPGSRPSGWDVADAISNDGWDAATVKQFIAETASDAAPPGEATNGAPMSSPDEGVPVDYVLSREAKSPATAPAAARGTNQSLGDP